MLCLSKIFSSKQCIIKQIIIRLGFCEIQNNQGLSKCQPQLSARLITLSSTVIIPDGTKTKSNNFFQVLQLILKRGKGLGVSSSKVRQEDARRGKESLPWLVKDSFSSYNHEKYDIWKLLSDRHVLPIKHTQMAAGHVVSSTNIETLLLPCSEELFFRFFYSEV